MSERWVKVTSEAELRAGCVVRGLCQICGSMHVTTLIRKGPERSWLDTAGKIRWLRGWVGVPANPCTDTVGEYAFQDAIRQGRLFRLDTGLDDAADRAEGRDLYNDRPVRRPMEVRR